MKRTSAATRRKIISLAEHELMRGEADRGHLDAVTELGCALKREIPRGEAFIEWIADEDELRVVVAAYISRGFNWEEVQRALFDLTRWRWLPPIEYLQRLQSGQESSQENLA